MKARNVGVLLLLVFTSVGASAAMLEAERMTKLNQAPITLYPEQEVQGSAIVGFFNEQARATDALVVSSTEALKGGFRAENIPVGRGELWIYVSTAVDLRHSFRKNFQGAKGVVFIPAAGAKGRGELRMLGRATTELKESAALAGLRYCAGLEEPDFRLLANAGEIARHAEVVTVYLPQRLRAGGKEFRAHFEKIVAEIRRANPAAQIELALPTGSTEQGTKLIAGFAYANIDLADRIGLFTEDTPESAASLRTLFAVFRAASREASPARRGE